MDIQNINTLLFIFTANKYWLGSDFQWTYKILTQFYLYLQIPSTG